ncbi:tryptophan synthase subunit alpha [Ruminococcus gauvreauii]|uniref:Tryptophan synthase alpha chain n=1 Tax=Ruminococcus gauvreauii TaxID=438033 RepID=A0ABY5VG18_9FIRM|nr:tryptophan synthase subunit alpha [Ruminococcus gauvreauii]UWP58881.1 tryptophan synthase subunit alpha [Ruminococcus gauvreauii]
MNRIENHLQRLNEKGEKAFITYMTAGLPDMQGMKDIMRAQEEAGVDIIELGIPFSDPVADGPVIQEASYRSILKGTNLNSVFQAVGEAREEGLGVPIVFMMYYNTILHYGLEKFAGRCAQIGVDGLIIPDLPYEEQEPLKSALMKVEGAPVIIQLVSPLSRQRIPMILEEARGFVYCVSSMGVTGQEAAFYSEVAAYLKEVKRVSWIPVMMGFGIREASDVKMVADTIDGAIVGSHFIRLLEESQYDTDTVKTYIRTFKEELNKM